MGFLDRIKGLAGGDDEDDAVEQPPRAGHRAHRGAARSRSPPSSGCASSAPARWASRRGCRSRDFALTRLEAIRPGLPGHGHVGLQGRLAELPVVERLGLRRVADRADRADARLERRPRPGAAPARRGGEPRRLPRGRRRDVREPPPRVPQRRDRDPRQRHGRASARGRRRGRHADPHRPLDARLHPAAPRPATSRSGS